MAVYVFFFFLGGGGNFSVASSVLTNIRRVLNHLPLGCRATGVEIGIRPEYGNRWELQQRVNKRVPTLYATLFPVSCVCNLTEAVRRCPPSCQSRRTSSTHLRTVGQLEICCQL